jgi:hypothetical protein
MLLNEILILFQVLFFSDGTLDAFALTCPLLSLSGCLTFFYASFYLVAFLSAAPLII